jgi:uncharacterized protein YndB with AHSA1/START domain
METTSKKAVDISTTVNAPIEKVWEKFTSEDHIIHWNQASPDWHCPKAKNDFRAGGDFSYRMEAKDGSFGFDFGGTYDEVKEKELIRYTLGDGRKVTIHFIQVADTVRIEQSFEAENQNPVEMQRAGWQAILDSFKNYTESVL